VAATPDAPARAHAPQALYTGDGDPVLLLPEDWHDDVIANRVFKAAGLVGLQEVALFGTAEDAE
jgi:hypothetical protein